MKYLVLGSSGQIGQALVNRIRWNKEHAIEFDIVRSPEEDLRIPNNGLLKEAILNADHVFFLAARIGGSKYLKQFQNSYEFIDDNMRILTNTFDMLRKTGIPFSYSTSQMAGMSGSYSHIKLLAEDYTKNLCGLLPRFWNVYSPEFHIEDKSKWHLISDLVYQIKTDGVIKLKTDGTESRQFLFGNDCADALMLLAKRYDDIPRSAPLDITSFKWLNVLEIAQVISKLMGGNLPATIIPNTSKDQVQNDQKREPNPWIHNMWHHYTSIETGIAEIIKSYPK